MCVRNKYMFLRTQRLKAATVRGLSQCTTYLPLKKAHMLKVQERTKHNIELRAVRRGCVPLKNFSNH